MIIVIESPNVIVVQNNINIMVEAAKTIDNDVLLVKLEHLKAYKKQCDLVLSPSLLYTLKAKALGYKKIITWVQGIIPEESYLRNKSKIKSKVLSMLEKKALLKGDYFLFVSDAMRMHYEDKYNISIKNKYSIFPCFNTDIVKGAFYTKDKYKNNVFVYAGGTAVWQGLENIVSIYSKIENLFLNTKLLLLIKDRDYALSLIKKYSIRRYEINYVFKEELPSILATAKYGFILRENNAVNNVSTPTKISTYLSCGIIPIFSESIKDFLQLSKTMKFAILYDEDNIANAIGNYSEVDPDEIFKEYNSIFNSYYSSKEYIKSISRTISLFLTKKDE